MRGMTAERWGAGLAHLRAYAAEHGAPSVPKGFETPDGFRLGVFADYLRQRRRVGKLAEGKVKALDELGFIWEPQEVIRERRQERHDALISQALAEPRAAATPTPAAARLRSLRHKGKLHDDEIARLDEAGLVWSQREARRRFAAQALADYQAAHEGQMPPRRYQTRSGFALGNYLAWRRHTKAPRPSKSERSAS